MPSRLKKGGHMTLEKKERAIETFRNDFNCSQAVLSSFAPGLNLDKDTALKIACGFGGGMGKMQHTCGAVTGAIMVLGLKYGKYSEDDEPAKEKTYDLVKRFTGEFKSMNNSIACRELLGYDLNNEDDLEIIKEKNLFGTVCEKCVGDAVMILENSFSA
jgi:C_GCAxxG_C_C family probable redox protein